MLVSLLLVSGSFIFYGVSQTTFQSVFIWRSLLLNAIFFTIITLFGTLFYSMHKLAGASWITKIQSILLSMGEAFVFLLLFYIILIIGLGNNFSWVNIGSEKEWYLNLPFFIGRNLFILGAYAGFCFLISKRAFNGKSVLPSIFLMFFGVSILFYAYDWIVSLDAYWYSTLFGWYLFSGLLLAGLSTTIVLVIIFEKRLSLDTNNKVNQNLARYLFAFSLIWAYLWYVQYLLVWYTNKPEEVQFFTTRLASFSLLFYWGFILSFVIPFVLLIANFARKKKSFLLIAAISGLIGQWMDKAFYIFPVIDNGVISLLFVAVGVFVFVSVIFWVVFKSRFKEKLN